MVMSPKDETVEGMLQHHKNEIMHPSSASGTKRISYSFRGGTRLMGRLGMFWLVTVLLMILAIPTTKSQILRGRNPEVGGKEIDQEETTNIPIATSSVNDAAAWMESYFV